MGKTIKILLVEDLPSDAELAIREIKRVIKNSEFKQVDTKKDFIAALESFAPDIIVSDYQMPEFDGISALQLTQEISPATPVIMLTGSMNEDTAVFCMKAGATDYVIKEHMKRLGPAVQRSLEEKQVHLERARARKELFESEERFRSLYQNAPIGIYRTTIDGRILMANPAAIRILGFDSFEELAAYNLEESSKSFGGWRDKFKEEINKHGILISYTTRWIKKDGAEVFIRENSRIIYSTEGTPLYYDGTFEDITENELMQEKLKLSEARLSEAQRVARIGNWNWDLVTDKLLWSDETYRIFALEPGSVEPSHELYLNYFSPEDRASVKAIIETALKDQIPASFEYWIIRPSGEKVFVHCEIKVEKDKNGNLVRMFGTLQDITEKKNIELKLKTSLDEKETLLRELYHRTKNNMQIIQALLSLKLSTLKDQSIADILKEIGSRIQTMALVHEMLYQSKNLSSIDLKEYITRLSYLMVKSLEDPVAKIKLNLEIESVSALIDTAIPCGLVLNELISNTLKHAFPGKSEGEISIALKESEPGTIQLIYSDNGIGVPEDFELSRQETLGMQSIFTIVKHQLQGDISYNTGNGLSFIITFNNSLYTPRV